VWRAPWKGENVTVFTEVNKNLFSSGGGWKRVKGGAGERLPGREREVGTLRFLTSHFDFDRERTRSPSDFDFLYYSVVIPYNFTQSLSTI